MDPRKPKRRVKGKEGWSTPKPRDLGIKKKLTKFFSEAGEKN